MQGVFLGNIKESDPHSAQSLRFGAGSLVHLAVAVLDVAQNRTAR